MLSATGQTYERSAIEEWLTARDTCPLSGVDLRGDHRIVQNFALRQSIEDWKKQTDHALRSSHHEVDYRTVTVGPLIVSARTKDVFRGTMLRKPVAVCVSKGLHGAMSGKEADILSKIGRHVWAHHMEDSYLLRVVLIWCAYVQADETSADVQPC
jgi:hypothetical protein